MASPGTAATDSQQDEKQKDTNVSPKSLRRLSFLQIVNIATLLSALLAVIALILSIVSGAKTQNQLDQTKNQLDELKVFGQEIQTRYLGDFMVQVPKITELVSATTRKLDVMADHAGYGQYSLPEKEFEAYFSQGKRILNRKHFQQVIVIPAGFETFAMDAKFAGFVLFEQI